MDSVQQPLAQEGAYQQHEQPLQLQCKDLSCHSTQDDAASDLSTALGSEESYAEQVEGLTTLLVFDWDDTLLPTTWLEQQGLLADNSAVASAEQKLQLQQLALLAGQTLIQALRYGSVIIITNAEQNWVELSCQKFLPSLFPLLSGLNIVSARSAYEQHGIFAPTMWKCHAFSKHIGAFVDEVTDDKTRNIISIGDSLHEQEALVWATQGMPNCYAKMVKFEGRPQIERLTEEHEMLIECLQDVVGHDGDLDLEVAVVQ